MNRDIWHLLQQVNLYTLDLQTDQDSDRVDWKCLIHHKGCSGSNTLGFYEYRKRKLVLHPPFLDMDQTLDLITPRQVHITELHP